MSRPEANNLESMVRHQKAASLQAVLKTNATTTVGRVANLAGPEVMTNCDILTSGLSRGPTQLASSHSHRNPVDIGQGVQSTKTNASNEKIVADEMDNQMRHFQASPSASKQPEMGQAGHDSICNPRITAVTASQ